MIVFLIFTFSFVFVLKKSFNFYYLRLQQLFPLNQPISMIYERIMRILLITFFWRKKTVGIYYVFINIDLSCVWTESKVNQQQQQLIIGAIKQNMQNWSNLNRYQIRLCHMVYIEKNLPTIERTFNIFFRIWKNLQKSMNWYKLNAFVYVSFWIYGILHDQMETIDVTLQTTDSFLLTRWTHTSIHFT